MHVRRLMLGPFESNCYLVAANPGADALVLDPGDEAETIAAALAEWGSDPVAILLTHAHMDHIGAVAGLRQRFDVPIYMHPADQPLYERAEAQAAAFGLAVEPPPPVDHNLAHGQEIRLAGLSLEVRHAPGHSPGGVVFVAEGHAFVGDCVFAGSIGRTDLPGGDLATLLRSINEQILTLPETTVLHTGHGPETTVGQEAAANPFLTGTFGWNL